MTPIASLSSTAQTSQLNATQTHGAHRRGAHYVMSEGNINSGTAGNAGAVQSFASILSGVAGTAASVAGGLAKKMIL